MKKKTSVLKNLWWIIKNIYQYDKGYIWVITFSVIILGIIPSIFTLISQTIINSIQIGREIKFIFFGVILYIALDIVNNILISAFSYYKTRFNKGFMLEIQEQILEKASRLSLQNYEDSETYDVIHRAQYEGSGSLSTYFDTFAGVVSSFITMFSYLLILVMFNPIIAAGVLVLPFIKFFINKKLNVESFELIKRRTNDSRKSWYFQYLVTHGDYYKELKVYGLFRYFIDKYKKYQETFKTQDLRLERKKTIFLTVATMIELLINGAIFFYIITLGISGSILIGSIMAYMNTINQIKNQMTNILQSCSDMNKESLFIDQLINFFDFPEQEQGKQIIDEIKEINIVHLFYKYKGQSVYALQDVTLTIKRGEKIALVGKNGSGKTTLIKLLMGFYNDYEGNIYIDGIELRNINKTNYLEKISALFQDFIKYEATFRENIAYGNLNAINDDFHLYSMAQIFGIDKLVEESKEKIDGQIGCWFDNGKQISLGQWQKIALCRTFIKQADIYFLDEPNAALDAIAEYDLSGLYEKMLKNKIGIIVAHKFNNFIKKIEQIVVLDGGKVVAIGKHEELLTNNNIYKELFEIQMGNSTVK